MTNHMSNQTENTPSTPEESIGYIVGGGLKANLQARLTVPAQNVQEGAFVVVESSGWPGHRPAAGIH